MKDDCGDPTFDALLQINFNDLPLWGSSLCLPHFQTSHLLPLLARAATFS